MCNFLLIRDHTSSLCAMHDLVLGHYHLHFHLNWRVCVFASSESSSALLIGNLRHFEQGPSSTLFVE